MTEVRSGRLRYSSLETLSAAVTACRKCPRLVTWREEVASTRRASYVDQEYWGRPLPAFGDPQARMLIVGLAPAAHGANRTGRMFTGDRSGDWLYRALHKAGFASQPESTSISDGLQLTGCAITNACHCAPPQNRPSSEEIRNCQPWLDATIEILPVHIFLALGGIAWNGVFDYLKSRGEWHGGRPAFSHGAEQHLEDGRLVLASYHPSQQNTFTGRLTEPMFDAIWGRARELAHAKSRACGNSISFPLPKTRHSSTSTFTASPHLVTIRHTITTIYVSC